jgi:hypothetical protein
MITRSQTNITNQTQNITYSIDIDFDEASRAWNANKRSIGNGEYVYICGKQMRNGRICKKDQESTTHICSSVEQDNI